MTASHTILPTRSPSGGHKLNAVRMGIETPYEAVVFMRKDCHVCRSEGFTAHTRIRLRSGDRSIISTLFQVTGDLLDHGEVGLSESAWQRLGLVEGEEVAIDHPRPLDSLGSVRGKVYGRQLDETALRQIIEDVVAGRYSDIHLSSFITACAARPMVRDEVVNLTRVMTEVGDRLRWDREPIADKHCVGGLPGNRTTPIVVAIVAACGLSIPKTSSRAITSPSGTADAMETLAPVDLDIPAMRRVVEREGGCVVWGGAAHLSPADDILIRIERALDLDSLGQLVASVLSKKIAAGATHLVLDLPVGPTAKIRDAETAQTLTRDLEDIAGEFGLSARILVTEGCQPVGRGVGPALEAHDVLAVLREMPDAPVDLRERAVALSGALLDMTGATVPGQGVVRAADLLAEGAAWRKFQRICEAQGGMREPPVAPLRHPVPAASPGRVSAIDNRRLAKVAKLAGAPDAHAAGIEMHVHLGDLVEAGQPLFTVHAETAGELDYSLDFAAANPDIMKLEDA